MDLMLNYVIRYGASLQELLTAKLTAFYNYMVLKAPARLIILMPNHMKVYQVDRHKVTFDEVTVVKYNPADASFWQMGRLSSFLYFVSAFGLNTKHLYIDHGKVFPNLACNEDADILVAGSDYSAPSVPNVKKKLEELGLNNDFPVWNFSAFAAKDTARALIQQEITSLANIYPDFIDEPTAYSLMSYIVHKVMTARSLTLKSLNLNSVDISDSPMIEDFYVLV